MSIIIMLIYLLYPALILYLCSKSAVLNKIGVVLLCYISGIAAGNIGIIPDGFRAGFGIMSEASLALALPLLLFTIDVRRWFSLAGKALLSMLGAVAAAVAVSTVLFFLLRGGAPDAWKLSAMAVGVYTGGTANLAAIKTALGVENGIYLLFHTYDMFVSLLYILFILSAAKKIFGRFLPAFEDLTADSESEPKSEPVREKTARHAAVGPISAVIASAAVVAAALLLGGLFPADFTAAATILIITSLSIALSFIRRLRRVKRSYDIGMYLIYIFSLVVASMADIREVFRIDAVVLSYVCISIAGSFLLHALFCRLFRIDADTFIITSVSAICSPPFVPVAAAAVKNRAVILSGLTTGIIGYAAGNYLGILLALILQKL